MGQEQWPKVEGGGVLPRNARRVRKQSSTPALGQGVFIAKCDSAARRVNGVTYGDGIES